MRYRPRSFLFLFMSVGLLVASGSALEFARLDLLDGRTLKNVSVRSYDAASDKVLLLSEGKALSIPVRLIPAPFAEQLRTRSRRAGESVSSVKPVEVRPPASAPNPSREAARPKRAAVVAAAPADPAAVAVAEHTRVATARAKRFFQYEARTGSDAVKVTDIDIEIVACAPIAGWAGQFRTEGRASVEFFDSKGWSYSRSTRGFEVTTEEGQPGEPIRVIDFTQK